MLLLDKMVISVGARSSPLSKKQIEEVLSEVRMLFPEISFHTIFTETTGDRDLKTSLRALDKSDFFTKEIDAMQLRGECRISIHSAKDLADPLAQGLKVVALTKGVDSSDVLVFRKGEGLKDLPKEAKVGSSAARRDAVVKEILPYACCLDIRGTIESRLEQLDAGAFDAVVMAQAALIRLELHARERFFLPGAAAPLQGRLAVVARSDDDQMKELFSHIDAG